MKGAWNKVSREGAKMEFEESQSTGAQEGSIFQGNLPLGEKLERARRELLDLSARNRLLNMPRGASKGRSIEIIDEKTIEVFRLLVREGKAFTFVAGREAETDPLASTEGETTKAADEISELAQPDDNTTDARGILRRHADTKLQTRLTGKGLQKRLLELYLDSKTLEEEQGVNVLFLTLGAMKWIDPNNSQCPVCPTFAGACNSRSRQCRGAFQPTRPTRRLRLKPLLGSLSRSHPCHTDANL
jgi:hypothetical protein